MMARETYRIEVSSWDARVVIEAYREDGTYDCGCVATRTPHPYVAGTTWWIAEDNLGFSYPFVAKSEAICFLVARAIHNVSVRRY